MKDKKSRSIIISFSIVILLALTSASSFGVSTGSVSSNNVVGTDSIAGGSAGCLRMSTSSCSRLNVISQGTGIQTLGASYINNSDVFQVTDDEGNESNPSILVKESQVFVAYESHYDNSTQVLLRNSNSYGKSWSAPVYWPELEGFNTLFPAFDKNPEESKAYGVFVSDFNNSGIFYEVEINNIGILNDANIKTTEWDWSIPGYGWYNICDTDVITYPHQYTPWIIGFIGSTPYEDNETGEGPCVDSPMFFFKDPDPAADPDSRWISWEPAFEGCSNLSMGRDYYSNNETVYAVCEQNNGSNQNLLLIIGNPDSWLNDSKPFINQTFTGPENLTHPDIYVRGDDILITAETDSDKIVLYHSNNSGQNWSMYDIATGKSPVLHANETHIACIYTESQNLSIILSANNLTNWTSPVQLNNQNGTVLEAYHNSDIGGMNNTIWVDTRTENDTNLYMFLNNVPGVDLAVVDGSIDFVTSGVIFPTRNRIKFTISNEGLADVYNIMVTVKYECRNGNNDTLVYDNCITKLAVGRNDTLIKNLFTLSLNEYIGAILNYIGLENITVTVHHPDDENLSNNAVRLGPEDISMETIFPFFGKFLK